MARRVTYVLVLVLSIAAAPAVASDVQMTVKPVLCITDKRNPSCEMSFLVIWESATTGYYCLFNDFAESPIRCWSEKRDGRVTDERKVEENFSFWMTDDDPGNRVAQVDVQVLRMDSDDRRRKRRTRHVWDIN